MKEIYKQVIDIIKSSKNVLVASHSHPDGDGIGSTIALALGIESLGGKKTTMFNSDPIPHNLTFLPYSDKVVSKIDPNAKFDATFFVDCAQIVRVGGDVAKMKREQFGKIVLIDHHFFNSNDFEVNCVDEHSAATGEVIYQILKELNVKITKEIANLIFCTFVVDSGSFRYSNTSARLLRDAADLVEAGASPWAISMALDESHPESFIKLLRLVLQTYETTPERKVAWISLTKQMFDEAGASVDVAEEFIDFPRSVKGVDVAVLFRQLENQKWKVSFRSKDSVDVQKIASVFGGGGHAHAAGCSMKGDLATVKSAILSEVKKHI